MSERSDKHTENWIATWGTAQQLARPAEPGGGPQLPDEPSEEAAVDGTAVDGTAVDGTAVEEGSAAPVKVGAATVRMVARATAGGTAVRIALSNSFGHAPVRIAAARIARYDGGTAVRAGSTRRLTFGGREEVVLPTGAQLHSDPVAYDVPAGIDLAVSLHVPDQDVTPTTHDLGLRPAWLAPGDQADARDLRDATGFASYLWLAGIDVLASPGAATVVVLGDSLADGAGTTPGADRPWPSVLARRLAARPDLPPRAVVNAGIAGNRVLRETDGLGASALARFDRDVLARPGVRWVVLAEGGNDIGFGFIPGMPESERATAQDVIAGHRMLIDRAHLHGLSVIGCTVTPFGGTFVYSEESERMRQEVNDWIRGGGEFDAIVDTDAALRAPSTPTHLHPDYDSGDHIHPNDTGNEAIAEAFDLEVFRGAE
jgi:lysophospholipase L1-like esterase